MTLPTWLEQQDHPSKMTATIALKHAILTRNTKRIKQLVDEQAEHALATTDQMPPNVLLQACCEMGDLATLLKLLEHGHQIDASKARLAVFVRKLFALGKSNEAKALVDWGSAHPDLQDQAALALTSSRLNLLKYEEYLPRVFTIAGLDPADTREAQACAVDLLSPGVFAKGGVEVEQIVAAYDAMLVGDWPAAVALIDGLRGSSTFGQNVRENLDQLSAIIGRILFLPAPQRPTLSSVSRQDEVIFGPVGDTIKTALFFGNWRSGMMFPIALLDRLLAGVGYNCIFLEDHNALSGSAGYSQLGPTAKSSAAALRNVDLSRFCAAPSARLSHFPFESDGAFPA